MKSIFILHFLLPFIALAQIENNVEGIIVNTPCELYIQNQEKNKYVCLFEIGEELFYYSLTTIDLTEEFKAVDAGEIQALGDYLFQYFWNRYQQTATRLDTILLENGQKAILSVVEWIEEGVPVRATSVGFLYQQKWFDVSLYTNNRNNEYSAKLAERIKVN